MELPRDSVMWVQYQMMFGLESPVVSPVADDRDETAELVEMYRRMVRIRRFEETASALYKDGAIPGFVHLSIGQEATAVGGCWPLTRTDRISSTHRGHGHCLAKGMDMEPMFAELFGHSTGVCKGLGGSMHIADASYGMLGANGIVGAGLPIATGSATASAIRRDAAVTVAFFGDGAVATGAFHESVNLAALWRLPIIFFCENNGYAEFTPTADQHPVPVVRRADGYGIEGHAVDGADVVAVAVLMETSARGLEPVPARSSSRRRLIGGTATTRVIPSATALTTRPPSCAPTTRCNGCAPRSSRPAVPLPHSTPSIEPSKSS